MTRASITTRQAERPDQRRGAVESSLVAILAGLLAARTVVAWTPLIHFDLDPSAISREAVVPFAGFGPAGSLALDALTTLAAAALLAVLARARALAWPGGLAIAAGIVAALDVGLVLRGDFENLWRGSAWVSAFVGCGALAACAAHPQAARLQRMALAVFLSVAALWLTRGAWQLVVEHPATVEQYQRSKQDFLAAQGWTEESAQALTYERRLVQLEATGWFGLANIMAGLVGAVGVACAVLVWQARRALTMRSAAVLALGALACAAIVIVNGSKGALAACALGLVAAWWSQRSSWHARVAVLAALAIPVVAIVVRGAIGESLGERSLFFRSQYWVGAWQVMLDAWPWGCGPDSFQAAYTLHRPALSVEEVTSAHAAPVDWMATMGLAGVLMSAAWVVLLWVCGGAAAQDAQKHHAERGDATASAEARESWMVSLLGLSVVGVIAMLADPAGRVLPAVGIVLAGVLARAIIGGLTKLDARAQRVMITGLAVVLAADAMVEMTLWQPGSASWVLGVIGALAMGSGAAFIKTPRRTATMSETTADLAVTSSPCATAQWPIVLASICLVGIATLQGATAWVTHRQERAVDAAAETLVENLFTPPARACAAEQLRTAVEDEPVLRRHLLLLKSADQFLQAGLGDRDPARARVWFGEALDSARAASSAFPLRSALVSAATVDAMVERGMIGWDQVIAVRTDVLSHDPRHTMSLVRLADAYEKAGDHRAARDAAQRALDADDSFRLDPLRQLPAAVRERLRGALMR
ncbi:MAG: hypothetical protein FJ254_03645 [Phycisphaerae bacterium]|nr:hypothetical protein [Phycisphaerae bacterium]